MAYWWVSQNQTYLQERDGGYLWAPFQDSKGHVPYHWATMSQIKSGDIIFSYVGQCIVSVAVARSQAYFSLQPSEFEVGELWLPEGQRIDVDYQDLPQPIRLADLLDDLKPLLPEKYSPLTKNGTGNQGYLFSLPPRAGRFLLEHLDLEPIDRTTDELLEQSIERTIPDITTRQATVQSRVGQGQFRKDVLRIWKNECCVTECNVVELLKASHIKPWRDSDNQERLDPYNGLLLTPNYDSAFDRGLITFEDNGEIVVSTVLSLGNIRALGISPCAQIWGLKSLHCSYLAYHREQVFRGN